MSEYTLVSSISNTKYGTHYRIQPEIPKIGLAGYCWQVIRAIFKYPDQKYYIYIGNPQGGENVWDFYFTQPNPEINQYDPYIAKVGILFDEESEFVDFYPCMKILTPEQISNRWKQFNSIIQKYFVLHAELAIKIQDFKLKHFDGKRIMGLHYRGGDAFARVDGQSPPSVTTAFDAIEEEMKNYDVLFICTDDSSIATSLISKFGSKVIQYHNTTRSVIDKDNFPMSRDALINWSKTNNGYKIGEDLLMEVYLMASTNFLLCGSDSNVNYLVRAINPNLPTKILFKPSIL